jgi:peroxiredoxin
MQQFVSRHGLTFPSVVDDDGSVFRGFGVITQPAWAFSDGSGGLDVHAGVLDDGELDERLSQLSS